MAKERVSNIPSVVGEVVQQITLPAIDLSDPDAIKREAMESLVMMLQTGKGDIKLLGVVKEILDRLEGRPVSRAIVATADNDVAKRLDEAIARANLQS